MYMICTYVEIVIYSKEMESIKRSLKIKKSVCVCVCVCVCVRGNACAVMTYLYVSVCVSGVVRVVSGFVNECGWLLAREWKGGMLGIGCIPV